MLKRNRDNRRDDDVGSYQQQLVIYPEMLSEEVCINKCTVFIYTYIYVYIYM
jgi:hypothetical protein